VAKLANVTPGAAGSVVMDVDGSGRER